MYPIFRAAKELIKYRNAPKLEFGETHVSHHICWPWDIDMFMELNNGRVLTLFDLGRLVLFHRSGIIPVFREHGLSGAVAGASVRYRRRVRAFQRVEIHSRYIGWDEKFTYMEHGMWRNGECTGHALLRLAVTDKNGLVPMARVAELMGNTSDMPLPDWAQNWIEAEATRPWPPMQD